MEKELSENLTGRPKRGDTEEELLRMQKEFFEKKLQPSAKIIKKSDSEPKPIRSGVISDTSITSTSRASTPDTSVGQCQLRSTKSEEIQAKSEIEKAPSKGKSLFAQRMENSRLKKKHSAVSSYDCSHETVKQDSKDIDKLSHATSEKCVEHTASFGEYSYIVKGREASEIHEENIHRLSKLSIEEIEAERQRVLSQLNPSTIDFLMSRRRTSQSVPKEMPNSMCEKNLDASQRECVVSEKSVIKEAVHEDMKPSSESLQGSSTELAESLPIDPNEAKQWLHMNRIENEKLEWMKGIPSSIKSKPEEPYAARFDFEGMLLPYVDETLEDKGLHHHGEEPQRPGYTVQELMQLSRSSVQQQRIVALNTIGNILQKAKLGIYDTVLEQNLVQQLLDAGLFLLLRFSMDDISPSVIIAALGAMRNLLFSEPDEASLDYLLGCEGGLEHPTLEPKDSSSKKQAGEEAELKDHMIINLDVLKGAQRTNLIVRLGYILDVVKGPPDLVVDVLTHIARHSQDLAYAVASCGGLLTTIQNELITARVVPSLAASTGQAGYGEPNVKALRLMRVLAARSRTYANTLVDKFNIMDPILTYVSMSSPELPHIQGLVVGGFYLWQTLMSYGLAVNSAIDLFPILMKQLHYHSQLTSAIGEGATASGHELASALVGIVEQMAENFAVDHVPTTFDIKALFQLAKLIAECLYKWLAQLSSVEKEKPMWSCVKMIGVSFRCLEVTAKIALTKDSPDAHSFLQKLEVLTFNYVIPFLRSPTFHQLTASLKSSSFLLNKLECESRRDPENLPSLHAVEWGGEHVVCSLLPQAPHPLLSGLVKYIAVSRNIFRVPVEKYEAIFLSDSSLQKYIIEVSSKPLRRSDSWFARQEIYFLYHIVTLAILHPCVVSSSVQLALKKLVFRLANITHADDKHMICSILPLTVFSKEFLLWGDDGSSSQSALLGDSLSKLETVRDTYGRVLGFKQTRSPSPTLQSSLTSRPGGTEPALPADWYFAPLLLLYGQQNVENRASKLERDRFLLVKSCLQFLLIIETLCSGATSALSVTARWCRLALVFLSGSDFFLDNEVKQLLRANLSLILSQNHKLNFQEEIPGLSSFYDLYAELLLQFSSVSYGDSLFGAFILLPLQQQQDPQLRRMVWGEHAVVLRFLPTTFQEVGVQMELFLNPCETNPTLLMPYLEFLAKGEVTEAQCPVLYKVALHHVSTYIRQYAEHSFARHLRLRISQLGNKDLVNLLIQD